MIKNNHGNTRVEQDGYHYLSSRRRKVCIAANDFNDESTSSVVHHIHEPPTT
jgi:hypothetical protein